MERRIVQKPPLPELDLEATVNLNQDQLEEAVRRYLALVGWTATNVRFKLDSGHMRTDTYSATATIQVEPVKPQPINRDTNTVSSAVDMREVSVGYRE